MFKYFDVMCFGILLFFGVCFGDVSVVSNGKSSNNIYYDNIQYTDNVVLQEIDALHIKHKGNLQVVGDYYEISFDIVNASGNDVSISNFFIPTNDSYIHYDLFYVDGNKVSVGDFLKDKEIKRVCYRVSYQHPIISDSYDFNSSFFINYEQVL